jgi:hypothetical protein
MSIKHGDLLMVVLNRNLHQVTYDLIDRFMVDIEFLNALVSITSIIKLNAYELHLGNVKNIKKEKTSTTLLMNNRVLHYTNR